MFRFAFLVYVVVEVLAIAAVGHAIGAGWTILLLIAGSALGMLLFAAQTRKVIDGIGQVSRGERSAGGMVADSTLGAAGVGLLLTPGLVTSVLGLLALLPPTRWILRPVIIAVARRRSPMVATLVGEHGGAGPVDSGFMAPGRGRGAARGGGMVVDGEVVDGAVVDGAVVDPGYGEPSGPAGDVFPRTGRDVNDVNPLQPRLPRDVGPSDTPKA